MPKGTRGRSLTATIDELNPILRNGMADFRLTKTKRALEELDGWIRHQQRYSVWRQWNRPYTRVMN